MPDSINRLKTALADRYTIEREIGAGGMATVYLARDLKHDRDVAIKVLKPELASVVGPERFLNEIRVTANLHHPHIVPLFDSGEADGFLYFVMPHVEGESLREKLNREKPLEIDEALDIAKTVAGALDYAHEQGVIHRDIKPENILLHQGEVLVADFGIALAVQTAGGTRLTDTGFSPGTPHYMSPEQAGGELSLNGKTDLYSLGCVLYELLIGEPPFSGPNVQAILARHMNEMPPSLRVVRQSIPVELEHAVQKVLNKIPADRFRTGAEFAEALTGFPFSVSSDRSRDKISLRRGAIGLAGALVAVASATLILNRDSGQQRWRPNHLGSQQRLTYTGTATSPAISPDGTFVAYVDTSSAATRIFLQDPSGGDPIQIYGADSTQISNLAWFDDGSQLSFELWRVLTTSQRPRSSGTSILERFYRIPRLGGALEPLDFDLWPPAMAPDLVRVSVDGKYVARLDPDTLFVGRHLVVYDVSGVSPPDTVFTIPPTEAVWDLRWSTNGQWLFFTVQDATGERPVLPRIDIVSFDGRTQRTVVAGSSYLRGFRPIASGVLFTQFHRGASEIRYQPMDLEKGIATGEAVSLGNISGLTGWDASQNGRLVYSRSEALSELWVVMRNPQDGDVGATTLIRQGTVLWEDAVVSPDGEWVAAVGDFRVFLLSTTGGARRQITSEGAIVTNLLWSPDSRKVALADGVDGLTVLNIETGQLDKVSSGNDWLLAWSTDGGKLFFRRTDSLYTTSCMVELDLSNMDERMMRCGDWPSFTSLGAAPSPDGNFLHLDLIGATDSTAVFDIRDGRVRPVDWPLPYSSTVGRPAQTVWSSPLLWTSEGIFYSIFHLEREERELWWVPVDPQGTATRIDLPTSSDGTPCHPISISSDGNVIGCLPSYSTTGSDVWVADLAAGGRQQ